MNHLDFSSVLSTTLFTEEFRSMFTINPFAELSASIPVYAMQAYVVVMVLFVIGGTVLDMLHKKSAQYFFENAKKAEMSAKRTVSGGQKASLAISTLTSEVLTSSEFNNQKRYVEQYCTSHQCDLGPQRKISQRWPRQHSPGIDHLQYCPYKCELKIDENK